MAGTTEKLIIAHNKNAQSRKLVAYYNQKSIMEKNGVARSEKAHSAFLANLLTGNGVNCESGETPLMWLLNILIEREENATACSAGMPDDVKMAVLTQSLKYDVAEVTPEKKVKHVAPDYFKSKWPQAPECEDTLDIYIKLRVYDMSIDEIEIIVENKILASENGAKKQIERKGYDDLRQTARYYAACSSTASKRKAQFFVFLTPEEVGDVTSATDKHFIQISYQDVLDTIITPLLDDSNLTHEMRSELENYVNALNLPTLDEKENRRIVMAITPEAKQRLQDYLVSNKELIKAALSAVGKRARGRKLTLDEMTLVGFAENKRNLFAALGADFANINKTSFFVIVTEKGESHIECMSSTDVAMRYASLYVKCRPDTTIAQLNRDFASIKGNRSKKKLFSSTAILKTGNNQPSYTEIAPNLWFENDMWTAQTAFWKKLLKHIDSSNADETLDFTYEVCQ